MKVIQGTTTSTRNFTWASLTAVKWPGSLGDGSLFGITAPAITSGADKEDLFSFTTYDNGTSWYGRVIGMDYS